MKIILEGPCLFCIYSYEDFLCSPWSLILKNAILPCKISDLLYFKLLIYQEKI